MKKQMGAAGKKMFQLFDHSSGVFSLPDLDFSLLHEGVFTPWGNGGKDCAIPITAGNVHHKFPTIDNLNSFAKIKLQVGVHQIFFP